MTLAPGSKLGPYEIVAPLGAGGMGEVYRARDPRLGREVAIKVLPAAFAADPDRMARFDREARALAALNHPHIAAIYGVEDVDGTRAIVQELVDGPTLADQLEAGALPVDEALAIARQIAEALEAAHERGIVHRDLKPGNVKRTSDGAVKVLDFGLARALDEESISLSGLSQSPTLSQRMTEAGMILGTAAYMSPEQAKGRAADRRADIWSFGVVLFEMLTGQRLFEGETASETMAAVMKDEIRWDRLPSGTPARVRALLERCLIRDPRQRLQSIGEARIVLEKPGADRDPQSAAKPASRNPAALAASLLAVALVTGTLGAWMATRSRPPAVLRKYPIALREHGQDISDPVLSPDGRWITYTVADTLHVRDLLRLGARPVANHLVGGFAPFWSPDSRSIAYRDGERLWQVPVEGGAPAPIAPITGGIGGSGGTWRIDGTIYLAFGAGGLFELANGAQSLREVLPVDSTSSDFHEPLALPGKAVVFVRHRRGGQADRLAVWDGRSAHDIHGIEDGVLARPCWSPSGHILFQQTGASGGVWALPFSLRTLRTTGDAFLVAAGAVHPSVSRAGTLLFALGQTGLASVACWWDSARGVIPIPGGNSSAVQGASLSPDGWRAVFNSSERGVLVLYVLDLRSGVRTRLTFGSESAFNPVWTPDGRSIVYNTGTDGVYLVAAGGGGTPERITHGRIPHLSADGRLVCVTRDTRPGSQDLYLVDRRADTAGVVLIGGPAEQFRGDIRPDGRLVAYMSEESGRYEIYLGRIPTGPGHWQVSTRGARRPRWSPDGRRLYFQASDGAEMWMSEIGASDDPAPGTPRVVANLNKIGLPHLTGRNWDVAADGRFLLFISPLVGTGPADAIAVENWTEEFRK